MSCGYLFVCFFEGGGRGLNFLEREKLSEQLSFLLIFTDSFHYTTMTSDGSNPTQILQDHTLLIL